MTAQPFDPKCPPDYVERTHHIVAVERELYLNKRRALNGLPPISDDNIAGLAISGGGVRAATLGLGLFQAFIRAGILKRFDYLSTVSGGGYIGACLSSLLSREPNTLEKYSAEPNLNERFKVEEIGLDEDNCPLSPKLDYEYTSLEHTRLTPKHQLLHLRRYGEYLTPRRSLLGWDVSRAVGALVSGTLIHLSLFLILLAVVVLLHHVLFAAMSGGHFIDILQRPSDFYNRFHPEQKIGDYLKTYEGWDALSLGDKVSRWFSWHLWPQFYLVLHALKQHPWLAGAFFLLGGLLVSVALFASRRIPARVAQMENEEGRYKDPATDRYYDRPGGQSLFHHVSRPFERGFLLLAYLVGPALAYTVGIVLFQLGYLAKEEVFIVLALPAIFAGGMALLALLLPSLYMVNNLSEPVAGRMYRSFYNGIQGASFLGLIVALIFPVGIILLFGAHGLLTRLVFSFIPVATAYYFTAQSLASKSGINKLWKNIGKAIQKPLLNLSIILFVGLALAWVSTVLFELEKAWAGEASDRLWVASLLLCGATGLLVLLGFSANANDISLHYFYRDRLTEAFLRTNGRVQRAAQLHPEGEQAKAHPKELFDVTLRNHESLRLASLGEDNGKGPYHIIVAALNLQGTEDLAQKTQKSDHFIFSKYFVGSRTTGYYRTHKYRKGGMKLNTAMTISAAAVTGGMGFMGFAASNFYLTLLNLRTGYWIENPWYLHKETLEAALNHEGKSARHAWRKRLSSKMRHYPFWLLYLIREITGNLDAKTRRVYVSDGGHTGDNLGLIPLIQRRCSVIVVADFEEDASFTFASFNHALRLAQSIYNVEIRIDLTPLRPEKPEAAPYCSAGVVMGEIIYPAKKDAPPLKGKIIYLKSCLVQPKGEEGTMPTYVLNYAQANSAFPHESTADQYFDEGQFEAYRLLGEYLGHQAAQCFSPVEQPSD